MCNTQASGQQTGPNTATSQNKHCGSLQCPQQLSTAVPQTQILYYFFDRTLMVAGRANCPSHQEQQHVL